MTAKKKYPEGPYSQAMMRQWEPVLNALQDELYRRHPKVPKPERDRIIAEELARLESGATHEDVQRALDAILSRAAERSRS